jgi:hypothetical protein
MNWKATLIATPLAAALVACPTNPPPTPDFTLGAPTPASLTFTKPNSGTSTPQNVTVTVTPTAGFSSDVAVSLIAPTGVSGISASPQTVTGGNGNATLAVTVSSTAPTGANTFTIQAVGGGQTHTQSLPITVNTASPPPPPAAPLGVAVGTYNNKTAGGITTTGFAMLVRVRDGSNNVVNGFVTGTDYLISGPTDWNGNVKATAPAPDDFLVGTGNAFGVFRNPPGGTGFAAISTPTNGTYTVTTTIGTTAYAGTSQVTDANQLLPLPVVTATLAGTTITSTWAAVTGASSYRVQLFKNGGVLNTYSSNQVTTGKSFTGLTVAGGDTFFVRVIAYPVNITASDVAIPAGQFNISSTDQTVI